MRVTFGKTVIEAKNIFLGDAKGVQQFEAIKEGMHWVPAKGGKGFVIGGVHKHEPGSSIAVEDYLKVENLKAGSLYVTTPSVKFLWGADAKPIGKP